MNRGLLGNPHACHGTLGDESGYIEGVDGYRLVVTMTQVWPAYIPVCTGMTEWASVDEEDAPFLFVRTPVLTRIGVWVSSTTEP